MFQHGHTGPPQGPHRAPTGPPQGPHRAPTGPCAGETSEREYPGDVMCNVRHAKVFLLLVHLHSTMFFFLFSSSHPYLYLRPSFLFLDVLVYMMFVSFSLCPPSPRPLSPCPSVRACVRACVRPSVRPFTQCACVYVSVCAGVFHQCLNTLLTPMYSKFNLN